MTKVKRSEIIRASLKQPTGDDHRKKEEREHEIRKRLALKRTELNKIFDVVRTAQKRLHSWLHGLAA
jgi:hypothetical protein